jgi:hypothetical protein
MTSGRASRLRRPGKACVKSSPRKAEGPPAARVTPPDRLRLPSAAETGKLTRSFCLNCDELQGVESEYSADCWTQESRRGGSTRL